LAHSLAHTGKAYSTSLVGFANARQMLLRDSAPIVSYPISAQKDEAIRELAIEQGAVNFLYKPFSDTALLLALNVAGHPN